MPSIEALAMAGVDCGACGIILAERERRDKENFTPQHLLADQKTLGTQERDVGHEKDKLMVENWQVKAQMEVLAPKAVAPNVDSKRRNL